MKITSATSSSSDFASSSGARVCIHQTATAKDHNWTLTGDKFDDCKVPPSKRQICPGAKAAPKAVRGAALLRSPRRRAASMGAAQAPLTSLDHVRTNLSR